MSLSFSGIYHSLNNNCSDEFYIQFFQAAFPEIDFSQLTAGQDVQEMAENIQALIDLLGEQILKYDLSHIKGDEIVNGNPEHCINLLQLVQEISVMIQSKQGNGDSLDQEKDASNHKKGQPMFSGAGVVHNQEYYSEGEEDNEAQLVEQKRQQKAQYGLQQKGGSPPVQNSAN